MRQGEGKGEREECDFKEVESNSNSRVVSKTRYMKIFHI